MSFHFKVVVKNFLTSLFIGTFNHQRSNLGTYKFYTAYGLVAVECQTKLFRSYPSLDLVAIR